MKEFEFATPNAVAWKYVSRHRKWIEDTLGAPLAESVQLRIVDRELAKLAVGHVFPNALTLDVRQPPYAALSAKLRHVSLPSNGLPTLSIRNVASRDSSDEIGDRFLQAEWLDCPVALHFEGMRFPAIAFNVPHKNFLGEGTEWQEWTVLRRDSVGALLALLRDCADCNRAPSIQYFGGEKYTVAATCWNDVVMSSTTTALLRRDYETFFRRKAWFRANKLPFRRGYLLHGPPGNGKTSAIRAMLSHRGVSGHAINLIATEMDDNLLQKFFSHAAEQAPALVILEDIDRVFFGEKEEKPNVSLQQLLNCLDGVGTQDGLIVVATANRPEVLDTAILRRPGRFDRVIEFGNPTAELRTLYLQKVCPSVAGEALDRCVESSAGLSFAQIRESYILAGQTAFDEERDIVADDMIAAIALLQSAMNNADKKRAHKSGFNLKNTADRRPQ